MVYKIIEGKLYQESDKSITEINAAINRVKDKVQASVVGIATCKEEIAKQQNQINTYINNIKTLAKAEGINKELVTIIRGPEAYSFCTYLD